MTGYPTTKREARRWVREHWQAFMRNADIPDIPLGDSWSPIFEVWNEECRRLADRLEPRK